MHASAVLTCGSLPGTWYQVRFLTTYRYTAWLVPVLVPGDGCYLLVFITGINYYLVSLLLLRHTRKICYTGT